MSDGYGSDFKLPQRIKDPALMQALKFEYDACEMTGKTADLALHHVIYKSQAGDDVRANIVCLVRALHDGVHAADAETRERFARHLIKKRLDVVTYIRDKLGGEGPLLNWFERYGVPLGTDIQTKGVTRWQQ